MFMTSTFYELFPIDYGRTEGLLQYLLIALFTPMKPFHKNNVEIKD